MADELISFASKQEMLAKSKQFWNPDKTQFWIDSGVPLVIDRREGYFIYDVEGKRLVDVHLNGGTYNLGHRNPEVTAAVTAAMQRFGMRRTVMSALAILAAGVALSSRMNAAWQMVLIWGVMVGGATGVAALTLSATVVNRWFTTHRGLVMGILTASSATGQLVFLPMLATVAQHHGWRPVVMIVAVAAAPAGTAWKIHADSATSAISRGTWRRNTLLVSEK